MKTKNTRKGFTTVELVIVIAVIAILATVLIPTFSNMINQANLSVDKQNVRNMNMVLMTYVIEGTDDFGDVRNQLISGGYKTGEKFAPKTANHKYYWYVDRYDRDGDGKEEDISVILLVDETNPDVPQVVYPEDYTDVVPEKLKDIRMCFDLALPAFTIVKDKNPTKLESGAVIPEIWSDRNLDENVDEGEMQKLSMLYTFKADTDPSEDYGNWIADFYISVDLPENIENDAVNNPIVLSIAGHYDKFTQATGIDWIPITKAFDRDTNNVPLLNVVTEQVFTYSMVQDNVAVFDCGVVGDLVGGADKGVKLTVELRITKSYLDESDGVRKPVENGEEKVLGIFSYTFQ